MKTIIFLILIFTLPSNIFAQTKNVAVLNLDMTGGVPETYQLTLSDRLRQELHNTGEFNVMERYKMEDILTEQAFQITGCVSTECAVEAGKILGVKYVIAGSAGKVGKTYTTNIRMIDVETSEIIKSESVDCPYEIDVVLTESLEDVARLIAGLKPIIRTRESEDNKYSGTPSYGSSGYWTIGSTMEEVRRIQGTPTSITKFESLGDELWEYGISRVTFHNRKVSEYNNLDNNLKVK